MSDSPLIPITFEGKLSDEEKATLGGLRQTEPFRILRKLCAQEYAVVTAQIPNCSSDRELTLAQGQLRGIYAIYNMLMTLGSEKKEEKALPLHKQILHNSR